MKKLFILSLTATLVLGACDKVENAYPTTTTSNGLDWSLYPDGDSAFYVSQGLWPTFTANTNTLRNVLIEDFTGHQCVNCPAQTDLMEQYIATNPTRIFGLAIHAGPTGITGFQETNANYPTELFCDAGIELGLHFGQNISGSAFLGNPAFSANRVLGNGQFTSNAGSTLFNKGNACLASSLKINLQAATNYFTSTRGLFVHVEVDKIDQSITSDLAIVTCLVEDSLVAPQLVQANATWDTDGTIDGRNTLYVHKDILRGMIDNRTFGKVLTAANLGTNNKYYVNYSYKLPAEFEADNMKLYIYVYDKNTQEIYQVIEKHLL